VEEIKKVVRRVVQKLQDTNINENQKVLLGWDNALPLKKRQYCRIVHFKDRHLLVNVSSSGQLYQMNLEKPKLIRKLNKQLKKDIIEDIYFRIGSIK
jgi:hypothetical protein